MLEAWSYEEVILQAPVRLNLAAGCKNMADPTGGGWGGGCGSRRVEGQQKGVACQRALTLELAALAGCKLKDCPALLHCWQNNSILAVQLDSMYYAPDCKGLSLCQHISVGTHLCALHRSLPDCFV